MGATTVEDRRPAVQVQVGASVPANMHAELARLAERNDRSIAAELRVAVRRHLEREASAA